MLSIIIPTFNSEETVLESYLSTLSTGVKDQEVIFVDDGSTDNTWQIIGEIQSNSSEVTFFKNEQNLGGGATRNRGVYKAKHPLIFILDSDDVLLPGSLAAAIQELKLSSADGIATAQSIFFSADTSKPSKIIRYEPGYPSFRNLVSHNPNPVIGNLLFRKQAYLDVGGYPTHHSFDTQGFGFRLLKNNKKIKVGNTVLYYQRIPLRPSYYVREAKAGNINRNWFYVFLECLYKFSPQIRRMILEFPFANPRELAKGHHLFNVLADQSAKSDIFSKESIDLDDQQAYLLYKNSQDSCLSAWCFFYEVNSGLYENAFERFGQINFPSNKMRLLYPFIANLIGNKLSANDIEDLSYFFGQNKSSTWQLGFLIQKIFNKLKLGKFF